MLDNYLIIDYNRLKKGGGYMKGKIKFVLVLTIIVCVVLFRTFIATPVRVDGGSMEHTLNNNDILILIFINFKMQRYGKNLLYASLYQIDLYLQIHTVRIVGL